MSMAEPPHWPYLHPRCWFLGFLSLPFTGARLRGDGLEAGGARDPPRDGLELRQVPLLRRAWRKRSQESPFAGDWGLVGS